MLTMPKMTIIGIVKRFKKWGFCDKAKSKTLKFEHSLRFVAPHKKGNGPKMHKNCINIQKILHKREK